MGYYKKDRRGMCTHIVGPRRNRSQNTCIGPGCTHRARRRSRCRARRLDRSLESHKSRCKMESCSIRCRKRTSPRRLSPHKPGLSCSRRTQNYNLAPQSPACTQARPSYSTHGQNPQLDNSFGTNRRSKHHFRRFYTAQGTC